MGYRLSACAVVVLIVHAPAFAQGTAGRGQQGGARATAPAPVTSRSPTSPVSGDAANGKKLYFEYACYSCHGYNGETGVIRNAVLLLHGTSGTGANFLAPEFAGQLFEQGQLLDGNTHFIIIPDAIGTGRSSKV